MWRPSAWESRAGAMRAIRDEAPSPVADSDLALRYVEPLLQHLGRHHAHAGRRWRAFH